MEKPTFGTVVKRAWWLQIIVLAHAISNSQKSSATDSLVGDLVLAEVVVLVIIFLYWVIKYKE